jgi:cysteinyl-tRNA synthetase
MEGLLPEDAWVLGIDEHTVLVADLDAKTVTVSGRGGLTVRRRGKSQVFPAGAKLALAELLAAARGEGESAARREPDRPLAADAESPASSSAAGAKRSPLLTEVTRLEQAFEAAIAGRRAPEAAEAILTLDRTIAEWSADTLQTDDPERARAVLHSLVQRLGEAAAGGLRDPREQLAPFVESLITLRGELRAAKAWELADRVRDRLVAARIEIRDTPGGTVWELRES